MLALLDTAALHQDSCKEYFDYLTHLCAQVIEGPKQDLFPLLKVELEWIQVCASLSS